VYADISAGCGYEYHPYLLTGLWLRHRQVKSGELPINGRNTCVNLEAKDSPPPVSTGEATIVFDFFDSAKARVIGRFSAPGSTEEHWLDMDTFGLGSPEAQVEALKAVTLADVTNFARRLYAYPTASVAVETPAK
jgi:hypothetical protein